MILLNRLSEWFKAYRRGERRIAPYGTTGRVYERKNPQAGEVSAGGEKKVGSQGTYTMTARIIRKNGNIEEL